MRLIAVAVPVPMLDALTYHVPEGFAMPTIGARVLVPLGNRTLTGIVVRLVDAELGRPNPELPNAEPANRERASPEGENFERANPEPGAPNL